MNTHEKYATPGNRNRFRAILSASIIITSAILFLTLLAGCGPSTEDLEAVDYTPLHELDMIVVTTADPFWQQHDGQSWKHEKAIINLVGEFINSLPSE